MNQIVKILMERDEITEEVATDIFNMAKEDLEERMDAGEMPMDICMEWFRLEPDYIFELLD